jgi:uncharacterized damage-inducible protein DinB
MFERELKLFAYNLGYGQQLVADIPDEQMAEQPAQGSNHPAWILGHLTAATDYGLEALGLPHAAPADWHTLFAPGQVPSPERALYPSKEELVAAYEAAHRRLAAATAEHANAERLSRPNPIEGLRPAMPTLADLLAHLLTTHEATHLGQLSAWRRQLGLPPV